MSDIVLNPTTGNDSRYKPLADVAGLFTMALDFSAATVLESTSSGASSANPGVSAPMNALRMETNLANAFSLSGVAFTRGTKRYITKANGDVQTDLSPITGIGTTVGTLTPAAGSVELTIWDAGSTPEITNWSGVAGAPIIGPFTPFGDSEVMFRTATAPLRSGSVSILGTMADGATFNVVADTNGYFNGTRVKGVVDYETGIIDLFFVSPTAAAGVTTVDLSFLGIPGVTNVFLDRARIESLRYNAVAYAYLPLDAAILGIDPVRLPSDGRVPIFRPGGIVVVGNTASTAPATASNGGTVNTGRVRLSRVRVVGANGATITSGYTVDLETGIVTFTNVTGYSQPVYVEHRIEDMVQLRDVQINGDLTFLPALSHAYPVGSYISSALIGADLTARVSLIFDQASWDGVTFADALIGTAATATYNDTAGPMVVTNAGAETERWVVQFTSTSAFRVIGEHVGVIGTGSINTSTAPINPVSGEPYFTIPEIGWGTGWATGNILRFNTVGARFPVWAVRTVRQGPESGEDYSFTLLTRGDVDNPL